MARPRPTPPASGLSRRVLLAAVAPTAFLAACGGEDADEKEEEREAADLEIVRFLLGMEDVESRFWVQAQESGSLGSVGVPDDVVETVARNEREHVRVLERWAQRLGKTRPSPPSTAFEEIFAAGPHEVISAGASLENLSAAAYLGQINRVQDRNLLASLLAIHTVEGRQAAAMNRLAGRGFSLGTGQLEGALPDGAFAEPLEMATVRTRLKRYTGGRA
ncbi:MAG TPA: ferritin-like domain-containing protein [Solirubrobacteraceae bacterium]